MEFVGDGVIVFYDAGCIDLLLAAKKLKQTAFADKGGRGGDRQKACVDGGIADLPGAVMDNESGFDVLNIVGGHREDLL